MEETTEEYYARIRALDTSDVGEVDGWFWEQERRLSQAVLDVDLKWEDLPEGKAKDAWGVISMYNIVTGPTLSDVFAYISHLQKLIDPTDEEYQSLQEFLGWNAEDGYDFDANLGWNDTNLPG